MVHELDSQQGDADRLDALWDDLIRSGTSPHFSDAAAAPFVTYLDALAPRPDSAARARIRQRVFGARQENIMEMEMDQPLPLNHPNGHQPLPAAAPPPRLPRPRHRSWWRLPMAAMEVTAAFAVLAAIVVGIWMMRPNDGPTLPAASTFGSPASTPRANGGSGSIAALELDNTATNTDLSITVQRVTLPPNSGWTFPDDAFPPVPVPVSQFVESGTLTVGVRGQNVQVTAGNNSKVEGGPQYLLNSGPEPVTFLQLLAHVTENAAPEPPSTATVTTIADVPLPASPSETQTIITLNRSSIVDPGEPALPIVSRGQVIFIAVETGTLRVVTASKPNGTVLKAGESLTDTSDSGVLGTEIIGNDRVTTIYLGRQVLSAADRAATDPRFGSTVDWQIPDGGGNVGFLLNQLTLAPAAEMSFDLDGAIHIRALTGILHVTTDTTNQNLSADQRATASGKTHIVIRNVSTQSAVVLLGLAYGEWADASGITHENRTGQISVTALGAGVTHLPGGPATVSLAPVSIPSEVGGSSSTYLQNGASLIAATQGSVMLTRMAGDIDIQHNVSTPSATPEPGTASPQLGSAIEIGVDDSIFVYPHAGYRVELTADSAETSPRLFALSVTSLKQDSVHIPATPAATPAPAEAFTVSGDASCDIAPRTVDELTSILNPEAVAGTPDLGLRDQQEIGAPADPDTVAGVRQTVTDLAACQSNGSALQTYALYSANAIRLMAEANGLTAEDLAAEGDDVPDTRATRSENSRERGMRIVIGDVITYPDGRAGATVNFDGEIAYLTFVHEGDRWLIDAWDDR